MCSIAGIINLPFNKEISDSMLRTMQRRGPDQNGIYSDSNCCLLHSRLAIIDPAGGIQPMSIRMGQRLFTIVYNGELYNTQEIRKQLLKEGHHFATLSDTEVVLRAYIQWGAGSLDLLNGIFAYGIWEKQTKELFLARDRIGVKPLFYKFHNKGFLFASEMKTILSYPQVEAKLDEFGAAQLLLLGPGRIQGSGVLSGFYELKPGHYAVFKDEKLVDVCYWKLRDREHHHSFEDTAQYVKYLVTDSVERQMVSDVPLGTFLSGGLDSSIITAICANKRKENGETLKSFSVDYRNNELYFTPSKFQPNSDGEYINLVKEQFNTDHRTTVLTTEDLYQALESATIARDLPGMADVDFSLLAFCKEIRKDVKVALSGECADEIFGGYPWYRDLEVRALEGFPWAQNTQYRAAFLNGDVTAKLDPKAFVMDLYRETIEQADILPETDEENTRIKQMVNLNFNWFMQTLLDRKDRMSMFQSLEVRVPFCDYRIAEYLYGVPWKFKEYNNKEKGLLRYAMQDLLPEQVLWRKKSPYPKTFDPSYLELVSSELNKLIAKKSAPLFSLVRKEALTQLLCAEYVWPWYGQLMKVPQTIAFMLQINFWLEHYNVKVNI